ncbi:hypothetical protein A3L09_10185 [Thermococcus profundus]|uniref:DUF4129 domain-containing protein n=2 Tax=Thermococcus profundus TaxID=49899 RepID=A0A2Z2MDJ0_THEPR|nr:hypothetical protein A3L09_10185 [Thermococcus profundus]
MKRIGVLVTLLLIVGLPLYPSAAQPYSGSGGDDYGAYVYFGNLLSQAADLLNSLAEHDYNASLAIDFWNVTNTTYRTLLLYSTDERLIGLSSTFRDLAYGINLLYSGDEAFQRSLRLNNYLLGKSAVLEMEDGLSMVEASLSSLSAVSLRGEGGKELRFDPGNVSSALERVSALVEGYKRRLSSMGAPGGFVIDVSKNPAYALENVTVFGWAQNMSSVRLFIDNKSAFTVPVENGTFSFAVVFNSTGNHVLYAMGRNSSGTFISNRLTVRVLRAPTEIIASERGGKNVTISGYLLDWRGRPVPNEIISVITKESYSTRTNDRGFFSISFPLTSPINAIVLFNGSELYAPSYTTFPIFPGKSAPVILLSYGRSQVGVGERIRIKGSVSPQVPLTITIYVDESPYKRMKVDGVFSFEVSLRKGTHRIYAVFSGNEVFAPARSNVLVITATPINYTLRALLLFLGLLLTGALYWALTKRKREVGVEETTAPETVPQKKEEGGIPPDVVEIYRFLYRFFRRLLFLPPSTTPRELLKWVRGSYLEDLAELTRLHERAVYAKERLGSLDVRGLLKKASMVIVSALVGDEL